MIVTWFVDLIWMVYWIPHWNSDEMKDWQKGLHNSVIFFTIVNFLMKIPIIIMVGVSYHRDRMARGKPIIGMGAGKQGQLH